MRLGVLGVGRIGTVHATTLSGLPGVESLVLADADGDRVAELAAGLGAEHVPDTAALFDAGLDGLVVATPTETHPELLLAAVSAGLPVFCEKPVAADLTATRAVLEAVGTTQEAVQIGFQRRFDPGFTAARRALRAGALGWLHTVRATTLDAAPPPPAYVAGSGGLFRDCSIHDFDVIRWVTGREVVEVYAAGGNRGEEHFRASGDVDTAAAVLTLDDGALALVSGGRYNAAGYDARLELLGSADSVVAGLDGRTPLRSVEPGAPVAAEPAHTDFRDRFRHAYRAEMAAFTDVVARRAPSPCGVPDALAALRVAEACALSVRERRPVRLAEID
ncbi:Gfo/Idh/MocA family protein [Actinokineospora spheciospongiae]|uniref:Gfo/Idh/MocA family protein n=1 Tax=Actinokineospora spheciospongiae TaxID=909613 RepID=UPI000D70B2C3|nr:Gfo/Idh/MocA family oxidoreductase [Actinokineospora spheciospongiae]PWW60365.1 myo-inositol 2-dehydrogenase/D-chiro-inositol 1-dehydrogenase [Actinokineospora spheciospongiae]